jgi:8-oxo-dGTP pyrophosphatase MutT (NUDIX family)
MATEPVEPIHDQSHREIIDVLMPPRFEPNGETKTARQAIADGNWLGTFNIWLFTRDPEPSIIYQMRSPHVVWEPGKLDVAAGGHYNAGEQEFDGLRELREELGIDIPKEKVQFFGRKLYAGIDVKGRERKSVISVYLAEYDGKLEDMKLQDYEVTAVAKLPIKPLMQVFRGEKTSFEATCLDTSGNNFTYEVSADSFPYNFDDYQRKMAEFIALKLGVDNAYLGN